MKNKILCLMAVFCLLCLTACSKKLEIIGNENTEFLKYNGISYDNRIFYCADDDKVPIGYIDSGAEVYAIGNPSDLDYLLISGTDNSGCFIAKGISVPKSGKITEILIDPGVRSDNSRYLASEEDISLVAEITTLEGEVQGFRVENYYTKGNEFYYVYDDSKVSCAENFGGYVGFSEGKWFYSSPDDSIEVWEGRNHAVVTGIEIKDQNLIARMLKTDLVKYISYEEKNRNE